MACFVVHADEVPIGRRVDSSRLARSPQPGGYPVAPDKFIHQKPESRYRNSTSKIWIIRSICSVQPGRVSDL
ncbi:Efflux pump mokI [Fusarium oxysporum f. sp. albedinis]|nr:Efflux pump mokI [Fusarium oxysporum f. sp. albedinis]